MPTDSKSGWMYLDDFNWVHKIHGAVRKVRTYQANRFEFWALVDELKPESKIGPFEKKLQAMEFLFLVKDLQPKVLNFAPQLNEKFEN